jgi:hypothetical protein
MQVHIQKIGRVELGVDGTDEYLLVKSITADSFDYEELQEYMLGLYYTECRGPGSYFCNSVRIHKDGIFDDQCIVVVQHRYDV